MAALVRSLVPTLVTDVFEPPLDAQHLHVSLLRGKLQLENLTLSARHINTQVLGPLSPVHVQAGFVRSLRVKVDWAHLWSQPLHVSLDGLHLTLTHNMYEKDAAAAAAAGVAETKAAPAASKEKEAKGREQPPPAATATDEAKEQWASGAAGGATTAATAERSSILLKLAVQAKKVALHFAHPNALNLTPPVGVDAAALMHSPALHKLLSVLRRALELQITDVQLRYVHDTCEAVKAVRQTVTETPQGRVSPSLTPTTAQVGEVAESMRKLGVTPAQHKEAVIGVNIDSLRMESAKDNAEQLGVSDTARKQYAQVPSHLGVLKQLYLQGFAVWCDSPDTARAVAQPLASTAGTAAGVEGKTEEAGIAKEGEAGSEAAKRAGVEVTKTAEPTPAPAHDYVLPAMSAELQVATSGTLDAHLELFLRSQLPPLLLHVTPEQLQLLFAVFASVQGHVAATQSQLESIAIRHFRMAASDERDRYISLYRSQLQHRKISRAQSAFIEQMEREISFANLLSMRSQTFARMREEALHRHQEEFQQEQRQAAEAAVATEGEQEGEPVKVVPEEEPKGFVATLLEYFGFLSDSAEGGKQSPASAGAQSTPTETSGSK